MPLVETVRNYKPELFTALGAKAIEASSFFFFATFTVYYLPTLGFERTQALNAVLLAALVGIVFMPIFGALSDRIGRKRVFLGRALAMVAYAIPSWMVNQDPIRWQCLALVVGAGDHLDDVWFDAGNVARGKLPPRNSLYRYVAALSHRRGHRWAGPMPLIATALLAGFDGSYLPIASIHHGLRNDFAGRRLVHRRQDGTASR